MKKIKEKDHQNAQLIEIEKKELEQQQQQQQQQIQHLKREVENLKTMQGVLFSFSFFSSSNIFILILIKYLDH